MRRAMVKTGPSRERDSSIEPIYFDKLAVLRLDSIRDVHDAHPRPDERLRILSDLSMDLGRSSQLLVVGLEETFLSP